MSLLCAPASVVRAELSTGDGHKAFVLFFLSFFSRSLKPASGVAILPANTTITGGDFPRLASRPSNLPSKSIKQARNLTAIHIRPWRSASTPIQIMIHFPCLPPPLHTPTLHPPHPPSSQKHTLLSLLFKLSGSSRPPGHKGQTHHNSESRERGWDRHRNSSIEKPSGCMVAIIFKEGVTSENRSVPPRDTHTHTGPSCERRDSGGL